MPATDIMTGVQEFLPERFGPAEILSLVFHPLLTPAPAGIAILWFDGLPLIRAGFWIGVCVLVVVVPISIYIGFMKTRLGQDTSVRENRHQLYLIGIVLTVFLIIILHFLGSPKILLASIYSAALSGIIGSLTNLLDKVSLHVGVSTGISLVLFSVNPSAGIIGGLLTLAIGGARFHMRHHDIKELIVAGIIPVVSIGIIFVALDIPLY